jgi:hypothetical protein
LPFQIIAAETIGALKQIRPVRLQCVETRKLYRSATGLTANATAPMGAVTNPERTCSVLLMSDVSTETRGSNTQGSNTKGSDTQGPKSFNAEAFAMNIARAMETSGQALAAYL